MNIIEKNIKDLKPYEKNPRLNDDAVKYVAESIRNFGFKVPIIIDKDNNIVCGHKTLFVVTQDCLWSHKMEGLQKAENRNWCCTI